MIKRSRVQHPAVHRQATTLGKLPTPMCLCHQAVQSGTGQRAAMLCVREGLVSHWPCGTDFRGLSTYGLTATKREMSTMPTFQTGAWSTLPLTLPSTSFSPFFLLSVLSPKSSNFLIWRSTSGFNNSGTLCYIVCRTVLIYFAWLMMHSSWQFSVFHRNDTKMQPDAKFCFLSLSVTIHQRLILQYRRKFNPQFYHVNNVLYCLRDKKRGLNIITNSHYTQEWTQWDKSCQNDGIVIINKWTV